MQFLINFWNLSVIYGVYGILMGGGFKKIKKIIDIFTKRYYFIVVTSKILQKEFIMPIQFQINTQKAVEAVLWVIHSGESDMHKIWKVLYFAEKYHINNHGSPITGDIYLAMEHGTVPRWLYQETRTEKRGLGFFRCDNSLVAEREPKMDYLSQSDVNALKKGLEEYKGLDFRAVRDKNHKEPAWSKNYVYGMNNPIPFEDIIKEEWLREDLSIMASSMVL